MMEGQMETAGPSMYPSNMAENNEPMGGLYKSGTNAHDSGPRCPG